jgi:hypothetical protein
MAFKKVTKGNTIKINVEEYIDKPIEGYYLGKNTIDSNFGESNIHKFVGKDGKKISIWGFTYFDNAMENVTEKALCRITYKGKSNTKSNFGNYPHQVDVEVDEDVVFIKDINEDMPIDEESPF